MNERSSLVESFARAAVRVADFGQYHGTEIKKES